jgi:bifunctional UDP-N-acetylglucosamine pyrophosphorylase/glucosamine-1-phosphate N-acetyltransferase
MSISVAILAAGKGTRMKSSLPKVLHKISGEPMLFYIIDEAKRVSGDITVILAHQFDLVKSEILKRYPDIKIHKQDIENFSGTGGALKGLEFEGDKVLILNGDMPLITEKSLKKLIDSNAPITMSILNLDNPTGYGRVVIENGSVREIVEEKDASNEVKKIKSVNAGVYAVDKELLKELIPQLNNNNAQNEYYLTDIIKMAVDKGLEIKPIEVDEEEFMGVNSKYQLSIADEIMQNRIKKELMELGVTMLNPKSIYIEKGVKIEGESIIESGVFITKGTEIINSHIKANSVIEDSLIKNSSIGPLAHIRPNSKIFDSHIGNFVEVKKSTLRGVKAGHLSYLGDSEIGEGTNIGAGVITCNYDGKQKYKTKIGKDVFIGSDSQLVAPLTIEDETIIGAGSTITQDVPKGALALSRVKQKIVDGFFNKFFGKEK